ncbi:baseplate J/gp47 family protein [Clostridium sp. MD294]|uniref:baseplate J/gp47 family protein n=1 Tax=Clostridium sp. MD294 TaxID=97138 RepID=UPI0002C9BACA|nr:baseplate J/gp47 family protein [Clostridium sp. MD294]NDO46139.1 hypothetical protein [Clostridium sp. MD294]USF30195.1 hypothetical protein C820_001636 [Clostridium sp. MD294]
MLPLSNLNKKNSQTLLNEALQKLNMQYSDVWTDMDIHDPGITFLELLCYLKEKQQQSMQKIDDKTILQFAKILQLERKSAKPEKVSIEVIVKQDTFLPRGTVFLAKQYQYENSKRVFLQNNAIVSIALGNRLIPYEQMEIARNSILFQNKQDIIIYFEKPLALKQYFSIYIELLEQNRNAILEKQNFIPLSILQWQYYTENGWQDVTVLKDETYGFLFSGFVTLHLSENVKHCFYEKGFPLRLKVKEYGYEIPPVLQEIKYNVITLLQQQTKSITISFTKKEFLQNKMIFDEYLALEECFVLLFYTKNGFLNAEQNNIVFLVKQLPDMLFQLGVSDREQFKQQFAYLKENDIVFQLICFEKEYYQYAFESVDKGITKQKIVLKEAQKYCIEKTLSLFVKSKTQKGEYWDNWQHCSFLEEKGKKEQCYLLEGNSIVFGDNIHGKVPSRLKNNVLFGCVQFTYGKEGCIQKGVIDTIQNQKYFNNIIKIVQFQNSFDGENIETIEELIERMKIALLENKYRAVTAEEYEKMVLHCQGLCIKSVKVLPLYCPYSDSEAENTITVVVEPPIQPKNKKILHCYLENIKKLLHKTTLITTKIYVMLPVYIPLDIYGDFVMQYTAFDSKQAIQTILQEYIEKIQKYNDDTMLYHGDFFALLEALEYVKEISYLKLELYGSKSNSFGDSEIPHYAKVYLRNCYINMTYEL